MKPQYFPSVFLGACLPFLMASAMETTFEPLDKQSCSKNPVGESTPPSTTSQHSTSSDDALMNLSDEERGAKLSEDDESDDSWTTADQEAWDQEGENLWDDFLEAHPLSELEQMDDIEIKNLLMREFPDSKTRDQLTDTAWSRATSGMGVQERARILRIAAVGGSVAAMSDWGGCLRNGRGVPEDIKRGNDWFMMAARMGDLDAEVVVRNRRGGIRTPDALKELFPHK